MRAHRGVQTAFVGRGFIDLLGQRFRLAELRNRRDFVSAPRYTRTSSPQVTGGYNPPIFSVHIRSAGPRNRRIAQSRLAGIRGVLMQCRGTHLWGPATEATVKHM